MFFFVLFCSYNGVGFLKGDIDAVKAFFKVLKGQCQINIVSQSYGTVLTPQ